MKYSSLQQINRSNITRLRPAWIFHTGDVSDKTKWPVGSAFETTPLVVNGVMYVTTPFSRLIALDAESGRELWSFDPRIDREQSANLFINRGAAYWTDGRNRRLFLGTLDGRLFSIVAESGKPDDSYGLGGWIDLRAGFADRYPERRYGMTSPPAIYRNLVICGSLVPDGEPRGPSVDVRALRRANWEASLDFPYRAARRRVRQRHLAGGRLEGTRRPQRLGASERGRGARDCVSASDFARDRPLRLGPQGSEPVRRLAGGPRCH